MAKDNTYEYKTGLSGTMLAKDGDNPIWSL